MHLRSAKTSSGPDMLGLLGYFRESPQKEGRSRHFNHRRRRLELAFCVLLTTVIATAIFISLLSYASPPLANYSPLGSRYQQTETVRHQRSERDLPQVVLKSGEEIDSITTDSLVAPVSAVPPVTSATPGNTIANAATGDVPEIQDTQRFREAFKQVVNMIPDEMLANSLNRPLTGTRTERLRELGLRTRIYKKFFDAWEDLHLISYENDMYVQIDVVHQLLRLEGAQKLHSNTGVAQMIRSYHDFRSVFSNLATLLFPWTAPHFADHLFLHAHFRQGGRGLVATAGNDQAFFLLTTLSVLRSFGCDLPVEVMYLGDDDLDELYRDKLEEIPGVITRNMAEMVSDDGWKLAGWAAKPFAILLSSFKEVIFVDADAIFFKNPEVLFDDPGYIKTGALFFFDRLMGKESKKKWLKKLLPSPISKSAQQSRLWTGESGNMQESGVMVIDKWKHIVPLLLVCRMNGPDRDRRDDIDGVYDLVYGDKETYWLGWELTGDADYSFHQGPTGTMGTVKTIESGVPKGNSNESFTNSSANVTPPNATTYEICAPQLLHIDLDGSPLWFNGWILENKFDARNSAVVSFEHYMREPTEMSAPEAWTLQEHNSCCLTGVGTFEFTQAEKETLKLIIETAKKYKKYMQT